MDPQTTSQQSGEGNSQQLAIGTGHIDQIAELVAERLQQRSITSNWPFYETSEPTTSSSVQQHLPAPNNYGIQVNKSDLHDIFDLKKVYSKVPKEHRSNALKLMNEIEKRSSEVSFDTSGTVFIDGDSIPNSNFFVYFPLLYKKRIPKNLPGFQDFVNKLNSMGLREFYTISTNLRQKQKIDKALQHEIDKPKEKAWWLLV